MNIETQEIVKSLYISGKTGNAISKELNLDRTAVYRCIAKAGITRDSSKANQKHAINDMFFEIMTPQSAYWLGFIAADGNVCKNLVQIDLAIKDRAHLERFKIDLSSSHPVTNRTVDYEQARFAFSNQKIANDLRKLGILERKTFDCKPWNGPEHLLRHYWRGVIDGDGSLYEAGNKLNIGLTGTFDMCAGFLNWIKLIVPTQTTIKKGHGNCFDVRISGVEFVQKITKELYRDTDLALPRKAIIAERWKLRVPIIMGRRSNLLTKESRNANP